MALTDFLSDKAKKWSADVWDGMIRAIDARFKPLEEQLDIQRAATDKIVARGLQVIEDELAPVVDQAEGLRDQVSGYWSEVQANGAPSSQISDVPTRRFTSDAEMAAKATPADIQAAIDALLSGAPGALDTLNELAAALGDDANFSATVTAALATKITQADGDARYPLIANNGLLSGFRNKIINGDFDIWQRATSQTSSGYGSDDRWYNQHSGSTKTHSQQAFTVGQTDVPGNPRYFSRTVVTSVAGAGNYAIQAQRIEGVRTLSGKTTTLTFWAKADAAKNIAIEFEQFFGSGGTPSANVDGIGSQLIALTTAWQKFSIAVAIPSISGKTLGSGGNDCLQIDFWFDAGSSFAARAASLGQQSGTFDIAHVSLVEGNATGEDDPFSPRHIGQEIVLCERYYQTGLLFVQGSTDAGGNLGVAFSMQTTMRATPSVSLTLTAHASLTSGPSAQGITTKTVGANAVFSANSGSFMFVNWTADAEI